MVLGFLAAVVTLFDTTDSRSGEVITDFSATGNALENPWVFALGAAVVVFIALNAHRLGGRKEDDE